MILDPLSAYIGPTVSMNQANEVRGAFRSLYAMAQRTKCAVLIVAHMNKMNGISALYRTSGSIDIAGAVRSILTVTRYQRSPTQRVLVPVKSNLAAAGPALLFELSDHVEWLRQLDEDAESLESNLYRGVWPPPRGFPPNLSDQQEWSAEWGHFGGGIGTGQAAIKNPRK